MDNDCPTPLVLSGRSSKSPSLTVSSPESDGRKTPGGKKSPDTRCAICLGKLNDKAFTDICLHQFCFQCLLQWSKVKPECPLCKQPIKSIIHNVRSNLDYDQYNVERREPAFVVSEILHSYDFDLVPIDTRVHYRSTMTREYFGELGFLGGVRTPYQAPNFVPTPTFHIQPSSTFTPASERRASRSGSDFRRRIYEEDLWVRDLCDITGRYRECTPQFYRENPAQIHRVIPWLNREINSLMDDNESYTAYILDRILSFLPQYPIMSLEFRSIVEPYFGPRTDHFIHEFYTFTRSVYDINGFDQHASYAPNPNYATEVQEISSSNDDDSDIEIIGTLPGSSTSTRRTRSRTKKTTRNGGNNFNEPVAGPSGINNSRRTETIEVEDDNDDVKIIEYVKPEPEVVTLSSGDEVPSFSGNQRNKSMKRSRTRNQNSGDSSSESSDFSNKRLKSSNRNRKRKSRTKYKSEECDVKPKTKHLLRHRKRSSSSSSSSSTSSSSSSASGGNTSERHNRNRGHSFGTENTHNRSSSSSSSYGGSTTCSDYEQVSKSKRKKLSKGHGKKSKKSRSRRRHSKESKSHGTKKSKVKSCIVVPRTERNSETSHTYGRNGETSSHHSGSSRTENEVPSSSPSYWSLHLNSNFDSTRWRKNNSD